MSEDLRRCATCGGCFPVSNFYTRGLLVDGSSRYEHFCKACSREYLRKRRSRIPSAVQTFDRNARRTRTPASYLSYLRRKIAGRNRPATVTVQNLEEMWDLQQGRCALTGWNMTFTLGQGRVTTNCSIDRIDSSLGYHPENVWLVCQAANVAKNDLSMDEFLHLCRSVTEKHNG